MGVNKKIKEDVIQTFCISFLFQNNRSSCKVSHCGDYTGGTGCICLSSRVIVTCIISFLQSCSQLLRISGPLPCKCSLQQHKRIISTQNAFLITSNFSGVSKPPSLYCSSSQLYGISGPVFPKHP